MKLPQRPLGSTGLNVSVLGLGTVKFGRNQQIKYPAFELPSDEAIVALLDLALELGINLIDTAPAYGTSEERLGRLLGARRDKFVIVTKTGEEFADGASKYDFSAQHTEQSVERSLRRLKVDHLDCVLAHCPRADFEPLTESPVLETLQRLKSRGDIRSFGASTNTIEGGFYALKIADVIMATYSFDTRDQEPIIQRAMELKKGVLIKKGFGSGKLAATAVEIPLAEKMKPIFELPGASSLVVGTINPEHLRANAAAALVQFP